MVPRGVLMKSGLVSVNTARQVNTAHPKITMNSARPMTNLSKTAHSTVKWPIQKNTSFKNNNFNQRLILLRPKAVVNAVKGNNVKLLKPQLVGFGNPKTKVLDQYHLGKFDGKVDEGFFVGYSLNSKAFKVFNIRKRIVEENLHIRFSENTPNVAGSGQDWLFDIDALTRTMNYELMVAGIQSNGFIGTKASDNTGQARKETEPVKDYILQPLWTVDPPFTQNPKSSHDDGSKSSSDDGKKVDEDPRKDSESNDQEKEDNVNNTNNVNAASTNKVNVIGAKTRIELPFDPNMPALEDYSIFDFIRDDEDDGVVADMNNLDTTIQVESFRDEESLGEDASKQGRINAIDDDEDITLVNDQDDADMFDVNTLTGDEVLAEQEVATKDVNLIVDEVTLAQALVALKSVKSKVKGDAIEEPSVQVSVASTKVSPATTTTTATILTPRKELSLLSWVHLQQQQQQFPHNHHRKKFRKRLQDEFDEDERLAREKDEANVALTEEWDDIQDKQKVDDVQETAIVDEDQEAAKIKELIEIDPDEEEVAIDVIPLATKPPTIVDWKIHKEGNKNYYQIIRADGSSKMYLVFSHMLKSFDREDFLCGKLVNAYRINKTSERLRFDSIGRFKDNV
ncbi:hypothetical protein Tco_0470895 [Tanacetum coccineum]